MAKCDLLVKNIKELVTGSGFSKKDGRKPGQQDLGIVKHARLAIRDGKILEAGEKISFSEKDARDVVDAENRVVMPGLIDSHTHVVFAGERQAEFEMRLMGKSYMEIARAGGGILATMKATRDASYEELLAIARERVKRILRMGITTLEIKSGYGLTLESEIKCLRVVRQLQAEMPVTIRSTFLGAHAIPAEYKSKRDDYVALICDEMIPKVVDEGLADFCDVFPEENFFTIEEARRILTAAKDRGMKLKIHADEMTENGGGKLASELGAVSADHLLAAGPSTIKALAESDTIATLLPGTAFFLNEAYADARAMIDSGARVALATDFNPGSSMTYNLPLIMVMACLKMNMTIHEAICGATYNAAKALCLEKSHGSIEPGKRADFVLFDVPSYPYPFYHFGENHVKSVYSGGVRVS